MVTFGRKNADVAEPTATTTSTPAPAVPSRAAFPRVNLIPPQVAREARTQRAKKIFGAAIVASLVAVGGLFFMANGQVSSAQNDYDQARAQSAVLAAEATKYADVPRVKAALAAAQAQQGAAMGGEVQWSVVLNNLALAMPSNVSLSSFKASVNGTSGPAAAGTTGTVTSVLGNAGIGTASFEGEAANQPAVAMFLDTVIKSPGLIDPFATQISQNATGTAGVHFTATATLSKDALSHRFDGKGN